VQGIAHSRQRLASRQRREAGLETMVRPSNGFLSALSADDYDLIRPHLRTADLPHEAVLVETGETLKRAYFPHRGVISLVADLAKGGHVQVAMIGRDSLLGALSAMGDASALNSAVVLVAGTASVMDLDRLRAAADQSASLRTLLTRHALAVYAQVQQTAGCNAAHPVESRLSRCLLQIRDLSGDVRLLLTQEDLAQMIGARRNSVSLVANTLQQANFIHYSRGHIQINNLDGLRQTACECYATVKAQYDRLLGP
jgi:CRP-like cAMP-binding protein